jgi:LEA14-like dessication related protein
MKLVPLLLFSLLGAGAFLPGCTSPAKVSGITVSVDGFRLVAAAPVQTRVIMILRFTSEDVNAVAFSSSSYKLYLNGHYIGKAANDTPIGLPAMGSGTMEVTVVFDKPDLVKQIAHEQPKAKYRLESVLRAIDSEENFEIKTISDGSVDVRELAGAAR